MLILVGCEESQEVTKAFRALGHEAYSCDRKPCSGGHPEWHLQMDVFEALMLKDWDVFIFFPDCTYITVSGLHWNRRIPGRSEKTEQGLHFVARLYNTAFRKGVQYIGFENPVGCIGTRIYKDGRGFLVVAPHVIPRGFKPTQIIQPYNFNEDASKKTCLWLYNLPPLISTGYFPPRITADGKERWGNQTDSGQNKLTPSDDRAELRSKTYPGIAKAMAEQWGGVK